MDRANEIRQKLSENTHANDLTDDRRVQCTDG